MMKISNITPVLPVSDIYKEIAFFDKLGFLRLMIPVIIQML